MTFTKTSQKFGQWIDFKLNLVYGLGFSNDTELNKVIFKEDLLLKKANSKKIDRFSNLKFVEKFKEIKELTRHSLRPHERSNSCEINSIHRPVRVNKIIILK
jgi:hypothetical protein